MNRTFVLLIFLFIVAGCNDTEQEASVINGDTQNDESAEVVDTEVAEEVAEELKEVSYEQQEEVTPMTILSDLFTQSLGLDQYHGTVSTTKTIHNGDLEYEGVIETTYRVINGAPDGPIPQSIHYNQKVTSYETMYELEGYITPDHYVEKNSYTDLWYQVPVGDLKSYEYFYLSPHNIIYELLQVADQFEYNFVDVDAVELILKLNTLENEDIVTQLTNREIEFNVPYIGGEGWALIDAPFKVHLLADLSKGIIEQFIFNLKEFKEETNETRETYFVQNFKFDSDVEDISIPEEVMREADNE